MFKFRQNYWELLDISWLATILSFFIGFGIAAMFRPLCSGSECIVVHGPPVKDVVDKVFQMGLGSENKCVEFTTEVVTCPASGAVKTVQRVAGA